MGVSSGALPRMLRPDAAAGCCCRNEVEHEQAFTSLAGGVESHRTVSRNNWFDEPLVIIEFGGDEFVEV